MHVCGHTKHVRFPVGDSVGDAVGLAVVGNSVGLAVVGNSVGLAVVGLPVF